MDHVGIDLHKNQSQIAVLTDQGELVEQRIRTERHRFAAALAGSPKRVLVEASTESEWVARCLEEQGHEVIVADPNYAPMYSRRSRRVKTDRRDARALVEACRSGTYRLAHRTSDPQRHVRARLAVRESMVRTRVRYVSLIRALVRREGCRVPSGTTGCFAERVRKMELPQHLTAEVAPLLRLLEVLTKEIKAAEKELEKTVREDPDVQRSQTMPSIGPLTAACFKAVLDSAVRFRSAHQVEAYLGLVPSERSSGERQRKGRIIKTGSPRMRWMLVQAGWRLLRSKDPRIKPLQAWASRIAVRRGLKIAVVALARRLAGILWAMWRDGSDFDPGQLIPRPAL